MSMQDYAVPLVDLAGCVGEALERFDLRQLRAELFQRGEQRLRGQVADKGVLCEGTATEASDGGIEAAATSLIGCAHLVGGVLRARVQVNADLQPIVHADDASHHAADKRRCSEPDG